MNSKGGEVRYSDRLFTADTKTAPTQLDRQLYTFPGQMRHSNSFRVPDKGDVNHVN
jgi:hypothetical protein